MNKPPIVNASQSTKAINKIIWIVLLVVGSLMIMGGAVGGPAMTLGFLLIPSEKRDALFFPAMFVSLMIYGGMIVTGIMLVRIKLESLPLGADWGIFVIRIGRKLVGWYVIIMGSVLAMGGLATLRIGPFFVGAILGGGLIWGGWRIAKITGYCNPKV